MTGHSEDNCTHTESNPRNITQAAGPSGPNSPPDNRKRSEKWRVPIAAYKSGHLHFVGRFIIYLIDIQYTTIYNDIPRLIDWAGRTITVMHTRIRISILFA